MKKSKLYKSLTFNIVSAVTVLVLFMGAVIGISGYFRFTASLTEEYNDSAFRTAETAVTLINADNITEYLKEENIAPINAYCAGGEEALVAYAEENSLSPERLDDLKTLAAEYKLTLDRMNVLREKQNVTLLYVIAVDTSDYENFTSVFNCIDGATYSSAWLLGEKKYTTKTSDNVYQRIYREEYTGVTSRDYITRTTNLAKGVPPHITSLIPVKTTQGEVVSIMCVQRPMSQLTEGRSAYVRFVIIITLLIAATVIVIYTLFIRKQIVQPVRKIVDESARFASQNSAADEPLTDKISKVTEISSLAVSVSEMENATLNYIDNLSKIIAEKQRIGSELKIASLIQESSIPSVFPAFPDRKEFDLYASMTPAKEVGGDFYDFFMVDEGRLALVIADVSGKGVPAALFMMVNKIIINERALLGGMPSEILSFVNDRICANNPAEMFITVWLGILDIKTGRLTFANAGHDDPVVCKKGGGYEFVKNKHGVVIGATTGRKYVDHVIDLSSGDKLFVYTDGVPEATDSEGKMFTLDGMIKALDDCSDKTPQGVIEYMKDAVSKFSGDAPQFDDMTMLCLEYFGAAGDNNEPSVAEEFPATDENLEKAMDFLTKFLDENGCPLKTINTLSVAFEEIFVNVAHYAYRPNVGIVRIELCLSGGNVLKVRFIDGGTPYNPLVEAPEPDVTLSAEERQIGGLGIYMTKRLVDKVSYDFVDGKNILTLEKLI